MRPAPRDVILVGASAGGLEALSRVLADLPLGFPAAIGVTLHRAPDAGRVAHAWSKGSSLPVHDARDGEPFAPGRVYVAPPDHHLLFHGGSIRLDRGPKEHHTRPEVDPMLRSGAEAFGRRVVGVVLTGNLSDGVAGLVHVKRHGGLSVVQDPREAVFPEMPIAALCYDHVDAMARLDAMAGLLAGLVEGRGADEALAAAQSDAKIAKRRGEG